MRRAVTYTKEMRERAKADKRHLVTIDVPRICFQGPCSAEEVKEAIEMFTRWMKKEKRQSGSK